VFAQNHTNNTPRQAWTQHRDSRGNSDGQMMAKLVERLING
jgi:hypothetical protein